MRANAGAWSPNASLTYQWNRNGRPISGASGVRYRLTDRDAGARITVTVTGRRSGYVTTSRSSARTAAVHQCRVKGNADSGIYHVQGKHRFYTATIPEDCFNTEAQARSAGYRAAKV